MTMRLFIYIGETTIGVLTLIYRERLGSLRIPSAKCSQR